MKNNQAGFNPIEYKNRFCREKYDRIGITVPKGEKEAIKKKASEKGMSLNEYINNLINLDK